MNLGNGTPESPTPSSSVLMLRDAPGGLEVFLLRRHGLSEVHGGVYVFPGGKLDLEDGALAGRLDQPAAALREALGEPGLDETRAAALYVAAVREVFEEAGVLFAAVTPQALAAALARHRAGAEFAQVLQPLDLTLQASTLLPWARWITPRASVRSRRHFDARFFVAPVPPGQVPVHDEHETTDSVWLAPAEALRQYWAGGIALAGPQIMSLSQLARNRDVAGVLQEARSRKPPCIQPESFQGEGFNFVCYPGDPQHPVRERLLAGPTRLHWRHERYEPDGGLRAFLD